MNKHLKLLQKKSADLRKLRRVTSMGQTTVDRGIRDQRDAARLKPDQYREWAWKREKTLDDRIARVLALLVTGQFQAVAQLAEAMKLTPAQVRWALSHAKGRNLISPPTHANLVGQR